MSKKKDDGKMLSAISDICFPTEREAAIALEIFGNWIRTKTEPIYVRDLAAIARLSWPMEFYNYGWPSETLCKELLNGRICVTNDEHSAKYRISVPDPILISEEK